MTSTGRGSPSSATSPTRRVFRSNAITLRTLGAHVTLVAPPTLMPSGIGDWAAADGLELTDDLDAVLASGPDAVMMLRVQRERMSGGFFPTAREYTVGFGLTRERLRALSDANPEAVICHPGPMNRGLEIAADAADAAQTPRARPGLGRGGGADGRALPPARGESGAAA